ncbi:hypothetical protein CLM62_20430 [Streptomyces sp. SA15]|uniref:SCO4225 family membrane protein n=1 Tax=Streptomyces sp. SA15 TaxID=934019 RepID=UPI000BAEC30F|nr:hypothetical protein [Streptomyces sp. SA15]PAZ13864.1 hypothetical protein CLM62_20430 [Streptomyces sp. SA15]
MSSSRRSRALLALATDNWLSRCYLAAVVLASGFALYDDLFVTHADASLAGVWPLFLTAPLSLLFVALPESLSTGALFYAEIALAALVNAVALGALARTIRGNRGSSAHAAPSA